MKSPTQRWCAHCSLICLQAGAQTMWQGFVILLAAVWRPVHAVQKIEQACKAIGVTEQNHSQAADLFREI